MNIRGAAVYDLATDSCHRRLCVLFFYGLSGPGLQDYQVRLDFRLPAHTTAPPPQGQSCVAGRGSARSAGFAAPLLVVVVFFLHPKSYLNYLTLCKTILFLMIASRWGRSWQLKMRTVLLPMFSPSDVTLYRGRMLLSVV